MAISIDTVYQRVLALANKEQRGYITPQEFNLVAQQAQMEIFEQYFYDIKQVDKGPGNDTEFSDHLNILNEKISFFEIERGSSWTDSNLGTSMILPDEIYRLGRVRIGWRQVEMLSSEEFDAVRISYHTSPTENRPIAYTAGGKLNVHNGNWVDATTANINMSYIRKPATPKWGYVVVNEKALYNSGASVDFELHASDSSELVYKILSLCGIVIAKPGLGSYGDQQINTQKTQEKQ